MMAASSSLLRTDAGRFFVSYQSLRYPRFWPGGYYSDLASNNDRLWERVVHLRRKLKRVRRD